MKTHNLLHSAPSCHLARPSPVAALASFLIAFLALLAYSISGSLLHSFGVRLGVFAYLYSILLQGLAFALPALLYYRRWPEQRPAARLNRLDPFCAALLIPAALFAVLSLNWLSTCWALLLRAFGLVTSAGNENAPQTAAQLWYMLASSAMAPALCEELLFRGFLLPSLEPCGERRAILLSSAMFALLHGRIEALPAHLLLGGLLALLVLRTGSLYAPMLFHFAYNAAIMVIAYAALLHNPASLERMPTLAESLQALPVAGALAGLGFLFVRLAIRRGASRRASPLPSSARAPLPGAAKLLLVASGVLLTLTELWALARMLPGYAP